MLRALAILLVLCGTAHSEERSPRESESKTETTESNNRQGALAKQITLPANSAAPTIINVFSGKEPESESQCAHPKNWQEWGAFAWCRSVEWINAEKTIAIFTVILGFATGFLWWATRNLVNEAKETSKRELRAYISITPRGVVTSDREERFNQITLEVKNHGQTPAHNINYVFGIDFLPNPMGEDLHYSAPSQPINDEASLFPNDSMKVWINFNRLLTVEEFQQLETDKLRLHVWGKTFYSTVFNPGHHTNFVASVGGPAFVANLRAMRRKQKDGPGFDWSWGPGHGSGD
jgi:hypothetical protein